MRIAGTIDAKEELRKARIEIHRQEEKKEKKPMSVKRYGYGPQTVKTKIRLLKIDYNGRTYRVEHGTMYRINSIWFPRTGILSVEHEGITIKLRPTRYGIIIIPNEKKEETEDE